MILRALNRECLFLIVEALPGKAQRRFMQRLSKSSHAAYSVALPLSFNKFMLT